MSKCICSVLIEKDKVIEIPRTENPGRAKSYDIKRRRAIFYSDLSGKYKTPEDAEKMVFSYVHEHRHNVDYGEPTYF